MWDVVERVEWQSGGVCHIPCHSILDWRRRQEHVPLFQPIIKPENYCGTIIHHHTPPKKSRRADQRGRFPRSFHSSPVSGSEGVRVR